MMSYQNSPSSFDEDEETAVPLVPTILPPPTTTTGHRLSERMVAHPNENADDESSLFLTLVDPSIPSLSLVRQEEAKTKTKTKKLWIGLLAGGVAGIVLLAFAGGYVHSIGTAAAAVELSVGVDNHFGTCSTPDGWFYGWSCDNHRSQYIDCFDTNGQSKSKERKDGAFQTCFGLGSPNGERCWSESYLDYSVGSQYTCVPRDHSIGGDPALPWYVARPMSNGSCGQPCNFGFK